MFGALAAGRCGHLTTLGSSLDQMGGAALQAAVKAWARVSSALVCGLLAVASWRFVATEIDAAQHLAYGVPVWWLQASLPRGFALLGVQWGARCAQSCAASAWVAAAVGLALPLAGFALGWRYDGNSLPLAPTMVAVLLALPAGVRGTLVAVALLCSGFTSLTGGSGVTILALGGLLLPMLLKAGYPKRRGIGLVTSASALGVLLAPSVPLIMYAVIARVPIEQMFLAGVRPGSRCSIPRPCIRRRSTTTSARRRPTRRSRTWSWARPRPRPRCWRNWPHSKTRRL